MKPGDHPDFFRLPPPPGRSRESTIVLKADGRFFHDDAAVQHPGMARAFASWIQRHPDDGRFILSNGYDWSYLTIEDVPFFVESWRREPGADFLEIQLSDGSSERLDPSRLRASSQGVLYVDVKGGAFEARLTRSAQLALAELLVEDEEGALFLDFDGRRVPIPDRCQKA